MGFTISKSWSIINEIDAFKAVGLEPDKETLEQLLKMAKSNLSRLEKSNKARVKLQDIKNPPKNKVDLTPKRSEFVVTEHAVLRYLERKAGIPVKELKESILREVKKNAVGGDCKLTVLNGDVKIVVTDYKIVTIY